MSQFIAPHYTREFELRQNRIRQMRKQQEDSRTGNTLESRTNASFSTLARGDATKTFRESGRALGVAPPPSLRPHSAVRRRMENEGRSQSRERLTRARSLSADASYRRGAYGSARTAHTSQTQGSLRRRRAEGHREESRYLVLGNGGVAPHALQGGAAASTRAAINSKGLYGIGADTRPATQVPTKRTKKSKKGKGTKTKAQRAKQAQRLFEMALSDVIEEAKFTLNKPRPWVPSSHRAGSPEHHRAMNMDAMDRGIVHRASRRAPWPEHINSPSDHAMLRQTKHRIVQYAPDSDVMGIGHAAGLTLVRDNGSGVGASYEDYADTDSLADTLSARFRASAADAGSAPAKGAGSRKGRNHVVLSAHVVTRSPEPSTTGSMLGVKHGILVVKKGGSPMDLIRSALDQFRITSEVADVVLTDGADSAGRTLSQQEASAIGISLLNTAEEGLPDIDDKWEVTIFLKDVSNSSGIYTQDVDVVSNAMDYLELRSPGGMSTMSGVTGASGLMSPRPGCGGSARPSPKARVRGRAATPSGRYNANGSLTSPSRPSSAPKVRSHSPTGKAAGTTGVMTYVRDMLTDMRPEAALDKPHTYQGSPSPALINHGPSARRASAQVRGTTQEILAARMAEIRKRSSDHLHAGAGAGAGAGAVLLEPDDEVLSRSNSQRSAGGNSLYGDATSDILLDSRDVTIDVGSLM